MTALGYPLWPSYLQWRAAAGPFADFVHPSPFLFRGHLPAARRRHHAAAGVADLLLAQAGRRGGPQSVAVFLDAPPGLGLDVAARLGRADWWVAPLLARWPAPQAVLPIEPLLPGLRYLSPSPAGVPGDHQPGDVLFVLDAERSRPAGPRLLARRFDNRYDYLAHMLPPAARLLRHGARRTLWVGAAAGVPEDLEAYAETLAGAGLVLDVLRLPPRPPRGSRPRPGRR